MPVHACIGPRIVRVSEIVYCCDVTRDDGWHIPLGVIADMRVGGVYGLGVMARSSISSDEAERVGALVRSTVSAPSDYLMGEFRRVWSSDDPGSEFAKLPVDHCNAISFSNFVMKDCAQPEAKLLLSDYQKALEAWTEDMLAQHLSTSFWDLLGRYWGNHPEDRTKHITVAPVPEAA